MTSRLPSRIAASLNTFHTIDSVWGFIILALAATIGILFLIILFAVAQASGRRRDHDDYRRQRSR
jgi:hypothetical protein